MFHTYLKNLRLGIILSLILINVNSRSEDCEENQFQKLWKIVKEFIWSNSQPQLTPTGRVLLIHPDPFIQYLIWELSENLPRYREMVAPIITSTAKIPSDLMIEKRYGPNIEEELLKIFRHGNFYFIPRHPYNTDSKVFSELMDSGPGFSAWLSSSRSLHFLNETPSAYSVKVATNQPHRAEIHPGNLDELKADLQADIDQSVPMSRVLRVRDLESHSPEGLIVLRDIYSTQGKEEIEYKKMKIDLKKFGFIVRDLRPLQDGHYYLPAFSVPFVGRDIAESKGERPEDFWNVHYAQALGKAKARLLIHYGIQLFTPNPQNILIQLDFDLNPTGTIIFRDMGDSSLVEFVAKENGMGPTLEKQRAKGFKFDNHLKPFASNSFYGFHFDTGVSFPKEVLDQFVRDHDLAFSQEVQKLLDVKIDDPTVHTTNIHFQMFYDFDAHSTSPLINSLEKWLKSPEGVESMKKYALRVKKTESTDN